MRIFAKSTLKDYWEKYPLAKQSLLSWYKETESADWNSPNDLKLQFPTASIIGDKRIVFNINGNSYRLIVKVEYFKKSVFIIWFGSHREYDKVNAINIQFNG